MIAKINYLKDFRPKLNVPTISREFYDYIFGKSTLKCFVDENVTEDNLYEDETFL